MKSVEFYFDLGSPYSYLAYYRLLQMAERQEIQIVYKPILLGGVSGKRFRLCISLFYWAGCLKQQAIVVQ